jgi:hypothetical protein
VYEHIDPVNSRANEAIIKSQTITPAAFSIRKINRKLTTNATNIDPNMTHFVVLISLKYSSNWPTLILLEIY